jgi:single-stranded DNA-binding protein
MDNNEVKLLGRVGKIEIEYKENGTVITTVNLGVKNRKKEYDNFYITFFNTKNKDTAELLADQVKEGDYIRITGELTVDKFTPKNSDKAVYKTKLIGWGYKKVRWNDEKRTFVDEDEPEQVEE